MRPARGFSLIEILLVVVLITAVTAMAAYAMNSGMPGAQLRFTRAQAIATGAAQVFTLDARSREWTAPQQRHGALPREIDVVATGARVEQQHPDQVAIRFFPEGAATGGRFLLKRGDAAWQVDVEWLTGQVTLQRAAARP